MPQVLEGLFTKKMAKVEKRARKLVFLSTARVYMR